MYTTHGELEASALQRTTGFEDRPGEFVVWEEWRLAHPAAACPICTDPANPRPDATTGVVLVRRDAHVILKHATVDATGIAAALG